MICCADLSGFFRTQSNICNGTFLRKYNYFPNLHSIIDVPLCSKYACGSYDLNKKKVEKALSSELDLQLNSDLTH